MRTRFYMATLGCKINQYETESVREAWAAGGALECERVEDAHIILINSCAVTAKAVRDVRSCIFQSHRHNPEAQIIVTGCAAEVGAKELAAAEGVVLVVPQHAKEWLKQWPLPSFEKGILPWKSGSTELQNSAVNPSLDANNAEATDKKQPVLPFPQFSVHNFNRSRAVVKVQDGCSHRCTYCIVPLTRGASRSRSVDEILAEIRRLLAAGFHEIILSGVNLRQFGRDLASPLDFWDFVARLGKELTPEWNGRARFRISSLEPGQLGEKALDTIAAVPLLCPQLHISLQSGSYGVLKRMGRGHYRPEMLLEFAKNLHSIWHTYGLGADILMGFPGETEEEFAETVEFCEALPLTYAHVFPYSIRPETVAERMQGHLPADVKKQRAARIRHIAEDKKAAFLAHLVERNVPLHVVLQHAAPAYGVSEFYTECLFDADYPKDATRTIIAAQPKVVQNGKILVAGV